MLTEILLEVEDRAHHVDHFLGDDSLEISTVNVQKAGVAG